MGIASGTESRTKRSTEQIDVIRVMVDGLIREKLCLLQGEASILVADMEALLGRMDRLGGAAKVDDLKAGRWYRTAAELRLLQYISERIADVTGIAPVPVAMPPPLEDGAVAGEHDLDEVTEGVVINSRVVKR